MNIPPLVLYVTGVRRLDVRANPCRGTNGEVEAASKR
jgi:hypothetical protein